MRKSFRSVGMSHKNLKRAIWFVKVNEENKASVTIGKSAGKLKNKMSKSCSFRESFGGAFHSICQNSDDAAMSRQTEQAGARKGIKETQLWLSNLKPINYAPSFEMVKEDRSKPGMIKTGGSSNQSSDTELSVSGFDRRSEPAEQIKPLLQNKRQAAPQRSGSITEETTKKSPESERPNANTHSSQNVSTLKPGEDNQSSSRQEKAVIKLSLSEKRDFRTPSLRNVKSEINTASASSKTFQQSVFRPNEFLSSPLKLLLYSAKSAQQSGEVFRSPITGKPVNEAGAKKISGPFHSGVKITVTDDMAVQDSPRFHSLKEKIATTAENQDRTGKRLVGLFKKSGLNHGSILHTDQIMLKFVKSDNVHRSEKRTEINEVRRSNLQNKLKVNPENLPQKSRELTNKPHPQKIVLSKHVADHMNIFAPIMQKTAVDSTGISELVKGVQQVVITQYLNKEIKGTPTQFTLESSQLGKMEIYFNEEKQTRELTVLLESEVARSEFEKLAPQIEQSLLDKGIELDGFRIDVAGSGQQQLSERRENANSKRPTIQSQKEDEHEFNMAAVRQRKFGYNTIEVIA